MAVAQHKQNRSHNPSQAARVGDVGSDGDLLVLLKALGVRILDEDTE